MMAACRMAAGAALLSLALPVLAAQAPGADVQAIERGRYLATAGDCIACHSAPGGKPMAGGLSLATPLGAIVATNITPSTTRGIGNYTLKQFSDAVRHGVRADGANLYPAMPYTAYARVTDDDTAALYAYFMHGVAAVDTAPAQKTDLPFPFNIRLSMAGWNWLFLDKKPFVADTAKSMEWNRGAYLAQGLAHCSTCHTPRNALMAEQLSKQLGGADLGTWHAPNISSDVNSSVGGWSQQELAGYLRTGRAAGKAQAAGPRAEAIDHSLKHLSDADLSAIAHYVKSVPAIRDKADTRPVTQWGQAGRTGCHPRRGAAAKPQQDVGRAAVRCAVRQLPPGPGRGQFRRQPAAAVPQLGDGPQQQQQPGDGDTRWRGPAGWRQRTFDARLPPDPVGRADRHPR